MTQAFAEKQVGNVPQPASIIGLAAIARMGFSGTDLQPLRQSLARRASESQDVGALLDLSMIELIMGRRDNRISFQARALMDQQLYRLDPALDVAKPLRLLAFMAPGDFMANTPVEFLLEESGVRLDILYIAMGVPLPRLIPDHDVAIVAIAESEENRPLLVAMQDVARNWPAPVINAPELIARLTRDGAYNLLRDIPGLLVPANMRMNRATVEDVANGQLPIEALLPKGRWPIIVRPVDSHGGQGLEKLNVAEELQAYLGRHAAAEYYIAPFIDYRSADGLYRKCRIALIGGQAYGCHLAISQHWMVHYLNADMQNNAVNRAEESRFLTNFDMEFGARHKAALTAIAANSGLDYTQIDCAETPDGQLLLFEIGTAMIVHAMDSADVFPYKKAAMTKVFTAFTDMLEKKAGIAPAVTAPVAAPQPVKKSGWYTAAE